MGVRSRAALLTSYTTPWGATNDLTSVAIREHRTEVWIFVWPYKARTTLPRRKQLPAIGAGQCTDLAVAHVLVIGELQPGIKPGVLSFMNEK